MSNISTMVSFLNSSTDALGASETYTGTWEKCYTWPSVMCAVTTDQNGTLYIDFSPDGVNADSTLTYKYNTSFINPPHRLTVTRQYYRVRYVNGSVAQTYMRLQTMLTEGGPLASPFSALVAPTADTIITRSVPQWLDIASGRFQGYSTLIKTGKNSDVTTGGVPEDIWEGGGVYTGFPTGSAETVDVFSASSNDNASGSGARTLLITGLDANYNYQQEIITMHATDGTIAVTSSNTWMRVNFAVVLTSGSSNQAFNAGIITVRHTTTTANVFLKMQAATNQSQCVAYTVPANKTLYIQGANIYVDRANTAIATGSIWVRPYGYSPRLTGVFTASNSDAFERNASQIGGLIIPEKSDLILRVTSASATCVVSASIDSFLVDTIT